MHGLLDRFINYCINNQLVSRDNEAWLRYCLEKRISTLIVFIPFAIIAVLISGFWTAFLFITSFFYLRSQTNGYHAKTHWGCFIGSLLLELLFAMFIEPMLDTVGILVLVSISTMVVFTLAPHNHPMMNLDAQEYSACKKAARIRCIQLALSCFAFLFCGFLRIAKGISLGCAMTSTLLVFAKITERRSRYGSVEDHDKQRTSFVSQQND